MLFMIKQFVQGFLKSTTDLAETEITKEFLFR
jgi:hypothetical protein